ncbi:hypothetical protein PVK06_008297 [Gossypium arboreum]|uniref:RNase H type-1 domain-containing protein n=1 Tax=Gossypium arboreum TaxID=29729 RepID=A0ABR0QJM0_GOSAR|nr:hypothetical protein PVK06_008297 [Gossypium arboreum]
MTSLWNSSYNGKIFILQGKEEEAQVVWDRARTLNQDFCNCNLLNDPLLLANPIFKRWETPPRGHVKIKFDVFVSNNRVGYEVIARDKGNFIMGGGGGFKDEIMLEKDESYVFDESIKIAFKLCIKTYVIFITDNASLVNKVKHHCTDITVIGARIKESLKAFENFKVAKDCPKAHEVLIVGGFDNRLLTNSYDFSIDRIEDSIRILDKKAFEDFIYTLLNIWNRRNNAIFRGKEEEVNGIWKHSLKVDAVVNSCGMSFGIIARDSYGFLLSRKVSFTNKKVNPKWAELDALIDGFQFAHLLNVDKVIFESGCTSIVNRFCGHNEDVSILGYWIKEAYKLLDSFLFTEIKWINRGCNKLVDFRCNWSILKRCNFKFDMDYPSDIHNIVILDEI